MLALDVTPKSVHELRPACRVGLVAVSVCIANWNCVELLRRCLQSLYDLPQGVPFEVVITDNGSTDGAADMVAAEFPDVQLIRNAQNLGFSRANNQAAALATGAYYFFLNNDTELEPYTLLRLMDVADGLPNLGMLGPKLRGSTGEVQISYRSRPTIAALLHRVSVLRWTGLFRQAYYQYRRDTFHEHGTRTVDVLMGAAVLLPRTVFQAVGQWDEQYRFGAEDLDLSTQVAKHGDVIYTSDVEVLHHGRVSSRANVGFAAPNVAIGYVRYFRKAGERRFALFLYKLLVTIDTPLQLMGKLAEGAARKLRGQHFKAAKSWNSAEGLWRFMRTDLFRFWMA